MRRMIDVKSFDFFILFATAIFVESSPDFCNSGILSRSEGAEQKGIACLSVTDFTDTKLVDRRVYAATPADRARSPSSYYFSVSYVCVQLNGPLKIALATYFSVNVWF